MGTRTAFAKGTPGDTLKVFKGPLSTLLVRRTVVTYEWDNSYLTSSRFIVGASFLSVASPEQRISSFTIVTELTDVFETVL